MSRTQPDRPRGDLPATAVSAVFFSLGLGIASVALPLLTLQAGYGALAVGVLASVSAVSQLLIRTVLGRVLYAYPDRSVVLAAVLALALSCALPALSSELVALTVANLLQGLARGCYWTGSQTHAVRADGSSVSALARINVVQSLGQLAGPLLAGLLAESSAQLALAAGAGAALIGVVPTLTLIRHPPFRRPERDHAERIWQRRGVSLGCWAGVTAGGWRSLLGSYVPVLLDSARHSSTTIGALVAVANLAATVGSQVVSRLDGHRLRAVLGGASVLVGTGIAGVALAAGSVPLAGLLLAISGLGAGALQTLGPALAADSVGPEERGSALSATGSFRAAALLICPLGVAGGITFAPLTAVVVVVGLCLSLPGLGGRRAAPAPGG